MKGNLASRTLEGDFWSFADQILQYSRIVVDRPRGSRHPRHPQLTYPLDYGYLEETRSGDCDGIDVWLGSRHDAGSVDAVACTVDLEKGDAEVKLLVGCTEQETEEVARLMNSHSMRCLIVRRTSPENRAS